MPCKPQQLKDVCQINPRIDRNRLGLQDNTEVSFVPMEAVNEKYGVIDSKYDRQYWEVKQGYTAFLNSDVLFAKITPCMENGKVALATELTNGVGFGSTEFHVLRAHDDILPMYLYHFVKRETFRRLAKQQMTGAVGQQRVPKQFLENVSISLPPLKEQQRIVELLDRAENIKRLRQHTIQTAQRIAPALFYEMFGNPVKNEKGWEITTLGDAVELIRNGTTAEQNDDGIGISVSRIETISNGEIDFNRVRYVDEIDETKWLLKHGDILFSHINSIPHIGKTALYKEVMPPLIHGMNLLLLRPKQSVVFAEFLFNFIRLPSIQQHFRARANKAVNQASINQTEVKKTIVLLPPMSNQKKFVEKLNELEHVQIQKLQSATKAEQLFSVLSTQLLAA